MVNFFLKNGKHLAVRCFMYLVSGSLCFSVFGIARDETIVFLPMQAPKIVKNEVMYSVDFRFNKCPGDFWWYYDSVSRQAIVEFYDLSLNLDNQVTVQIGSPVKKVEINNVASPLIISNKKSQIVVTLTEDMKFFAECNADTLTIKIWRTIGEKAKKQQLRSKLIAKTIIIASLVTAISIYFLTSYLLKH